MKNGIIKIDTNDLRVNLSKYLKQNKGNTIYITRYNELIAELRVYTEEIRAKTELKIAQMIVNASKREKVSIVNVSKVG